MTTRISRRGAHLASERSPAYLSGPCRALRAATTGSNRRLDVTDHGDEREEPDDDCRSDEEEGRAAGRGAAPIGAPNDRCGGDGADHGTDDPAARRRSSR